MKQKPILFSTPMVQAILSGKKTQTRRIVKVPSNTEYHGIIIESTHRANIGKMVFVETGGKSYVVKRKYLPGDILWVRETHVLTHTGKCIYRADDFTAEDKELLPFLKWRPSIHMPRQACRLFLRVKSVRVERLCDITEDDAKAEGVENRHRFMLLWNSLNAKRGYGWEANPWVEAVEFERAEGV